MTSDGMMATTRPADNRLFWMLLQVATILLALAFCSYPVYSLWRSEWSGPYRNTTSVADLDVVLTNLRRENELLYWGDITLWRNQGGGRFTPDHLETPPYLFLSTGSGDIDGDGDADILALSSDRLMLFRNQGSLQKGQFGDFKPKRNSNLDAALSVRPDGDTGTAGSVVLGDLNQDGAPLHPQPAPPGNHQRP